MMSDIRKYFNYTSAATNANSFLIYAVIISEVLTSILLNDIWQLQIIISSAMPTP